MLVIIIYWTVEVKHEVEKKKTKRSKKLKRKTVLKGEYWKCELGWWPVSTAQASIAIQEIEARCDATVAQDFGRPSLHAENIIVRFSDV